jgi:DNA-binding SARP family transcriptional activator
MDDLRVRLLGGLLVEGLRPNEVGSRKARSVLAALAVARGSPVGVDVLAEILWGDDQPSRPSDQIGVLVSRARGVLGADRLPRHDAGYALLVDWLDLTAMDGHVGDADRAAAAGDGLTTRLAATMALDLVRGPLLPEEDAPWFDSPRATVARTIAATQLLAAEAALMGGDPAGALALAAAGLDHDPYDEAALRAVMRAHRALGRPASALAAYAAVRSRLREDLGVSPASETEHLHAEILNDGPSSPAATVGAPERWDPLVQRARNELAANDLRAARRDAEEAVRRGGGAGALEVAGWVAYYDRDFGAAVRLAEQAAVAALEDERRSSCLTLAGRVRHSRGDLPTAEAHLQAAVRSTVAGVRATGEVWLGALRVHQGRLDEAVELSVRGAVDAAAMRHPFVIPHSLCSRVYALGLQGRVAEALEVLAQWDVVTDELGPAGARFRAVLDNFWGWILAGIGRADEAEARHRSALSTAGSFSEPRHHALFDLAQAAVERGSATEALDWLAQVEVPPDEAGAMAWHQRQRQWLLEGRVALLEGRPDAAVALAERCRADAAHRGAPRAVHQAEVVRFLAAAARHEAIDPRTVDATVDGLNRVGRLDAWRSTARLAAATRRDELWSVAQAQADGLVAGCGAEAERTAAWVATELQRLGRRPA